MQPLLNVWITTYNHAEYIAEALDSVLMQKTTFHYNIILGDDFSTDGTREIILKYKAAYPDKFELFFPSHNLGMFSMFKATYEMCSARYIAWLDGDDYWTDPFKLQKQVDFLENNPAFVLSFHHVSEYDQEKQTLLPVPWPYQIEKNKSLSTEDFVHIYNPIYALSVLHRNVLGKHLPDWYYKLPSPDLGLYFLLLQHGQAAYFEEVMGVYRIHQKGAWSGESYYVNNMKTIKFFSILKKNLPGLNKEKIKKVINYYARENYEMARESKNFKGVLKNRILLLKNKYGVL